MEVPKVLVRALTNNLNIRINFMSLPREALLSSDKGDNEAKVVAVHRSPGIYLKAEENPRNTTVRRRSEDCATSHRLKWGPLPTYEIDRIVRDVMEKRERKATRFESLICFYGVWESLVRFYGVWI